MRAKIKSKGLAFGAKTDWGTSKYPDCGLMLQLHKVSGFPPGSQGSKEVKLEGNGRARAVPVAYIDYSRLRHMPIHYSRVTRNEGGSTIVSMLTSAVPLNEQKVDADWSSIVQYMVKHGQYHLDFYEHRMV